MKHTSGFSFQRSWPGIFWAAQLLLTAPSVPAGDSISLSGSWRFALDRDDIGITARWFDRTLAQEIQMPGALQNQGYGDDITVETKWTGDVGADRWRTGEAYARYRRPDNLKIPFFLQPDKHYVGAAWYQRDVDLPAAWKTNRILLTLERPHWGTQVWWNDRLLGTNDSLCTPHRFELGTGLRPGSHTLTIRVDNRILIDVGDWSHSVSDHTQGNWNGVVGRIDLSATAPVWIDSLQVYPRIADRSVKVKGQILNVTGNAGDGRLVLRITSPSADAREGTPPVTASTRSIDLAWDTSGATFESELSLGESARLWDEFQPFLYRLTAELHERPVPVRADESDLPATADRSVSAPPIDSRSVTFGLREIATTSDRLFAVNGRKTFLRGTLECCIFPLTGYPPTDVEPWRRIIRIGKDHGLNHLRFHSWCPPEAAFVAADELGFYFQVECGVWTRPGNGTPVDDWLWQETERILNAYGNHPSFVLMTHGNEPHGPKREEYLTRWVNHWKATDPRRLYTSGSAYPQLPENQYHVYHGPRGRKGWNGKDYAADVEQFAVPVIVHEMGQWCVYPNFDEIPKYTGPLQPRNFEIFRESLAEQGMLGQWRDFLRASGRLQVLCYKEEIEAALRTPGVGGIQLLDLHDFPGQGTALVGVLDAF